MGGHALKRKKAQGEYECDSCSADIKDGKRIFECKKCDYSLCKACYEKAEAELMEDGDKDDLMEAFCEAHTQPVRDGNSLAFKCMVCKKVLKETDVQQHMEQQ